MKTTMKTIGAAVVLAASMGVMAATTATYQAVTGSASVLGYSTDVSGYNLKAEHDLNMSDSIVVSHQSLSVDVASNMGIDNEFTATDISYKTKLGSGLSTSLGIGQADGEIAGYNLGSESYTKFNLTGTTMVLEGLELSAGYNRYFADEDLNEFLLGAEYSVAKGISLNLTHEMASAADYDVDLNRTGFGMTAKF